MINSISVVLPLFNEDKRLKKAFRKIVNFSKSNKIRLKQFIFVNDGSSDRSEEMIKKFIKDNERYKKTKFNYFELKKNSGKGAALKLGVKKAKGEWILTSDIDFSVSLFEINRWLKKKYINKSNQVYFGSRSHHQSNVSSKFYRKIIGNLLRFLINFILNIKIRDTQCGFKLYEKKLAKKIFSKINFVGFEHDIEIVMLLKKKKLKIIELPVDWQHIKLSKVNLITDSLKIFYRVLLMKLKY